LTDDGLELKSILTFY